MSPPTGRLAGRRAVVAGVGPGMGRAIVARFLQEGAAVVASARDATRLDETLRPLPHPDRRHALAADLRRPTDVEALLDAATRRLDGTPDILVNAAGGWRAGPVDGSDPTLVDEMLGLNLGALLTTTPPFARAMRAAGHGSIVNIAAVYGGLIASKGQAVYNATKAGVVGYTRSAAADLLADGIRVNCVLPGGTSHDHDPAGRKRAPRLGTDRIGVPEDVANAVLFLASDEARWVTGAALVVDGGESVRGG